MHKPILFTKEWDKSSPLLFKALVTNEMLKSVLFEFVRTERGRARRACTSRSS